MTRDEPIDEVDNDEDEQDDVDELERDALGGSVFDIGELCPLSS